MQGLAQAVACHEAKSVHCVLSVLVSTESDTLILCQAADFPAGSLERLVHVACFAVSGYAATGKRTSKPFNPLLGETYEFVCPEKGFRFISEKVRQS